MPLSILNDLNNPQQTRCVTKTILTFS